MTLDKGLGLRLCPGSASKLPESSRSHGKGRAPLASPLHFTVSAFDPGGGPLSLLRSALSDIRHTTKMHSNNSKCSTTRRIGFCLHSSPIKRAILIDYKNLENRQTIKNLKITSTHNFTTQRQSCLHCVVYILSLLDIWVIINLHFITF